MDRRPFASRYSVLVKCFSFFLLLVSTAVSQTWQPIDVPGDWESQIGPHDGFAWYRCLIQVPADWEGSRLLLTIRATDNVDEAYFNGDKVGANGSLPPLYHQPSSDVRRPAVIDPDQIRFGDWNLVAFRVYDHGGQGGLTEGPIQLSRLHDAIDLGGTWDFIKGDRQEYAHWPHKDVTSKATLAFIDDYQKRHSNKPAGHLGVVPADKESRERDLALVRERFEGNANVHSNIDGKGDPLPPEQALAALSPGTDFVIDSVLHEPEITQPLYVEFDARGRLWVCQYIQYPKPAGLEVLTWDNHLRTVFDRVPPPPPYDHPDTRRFRGRDKITIHEDTDGDGTFDHHKVFVDGLNIVTATCQGHGGVWVMNPPYLLFYPDQDQDDAPDGPPTVHLAGFGLEDTHSVANSLKWGPDGWLYGATGSTVTARIRVASRPEDPPHAFFGQNIWRYHPKTHAFELFAEGGWNTFGVDFDAKGRLFSGTNGSMQAVHFVQGGYYQKSFGKHGPHTNPHAFDYFHGIPIEGKHPRLVQQWVPYHGGAFPGHEGHFIGVNCLANEVPIIQTFPNGSTYTSKVIEPAITSADVWFRPVHLTTGPDGHVYVSDFYDARITHVDPRDNWDRAHGRIYRLRHRRGKRYAPLGNLHQADLGTLLELLDHPNQWQRWTARRVLVERQDPFAVPELLERLRQPGQGALEALWTLHGLHKLDETTALEGLRHDDVHLRLWTIRLLGDRRETLSPALFDAVQDLATDSDPQLISQLAATLQRLPRHQALSILDRLLQTGRFTSDPFIPSQLWWALESQLGADPAAVLSQIPLSTYQSPIGETKLVTLLGRRLGADPSPENLRAVATLITRLPRALALHTIRGLETSLQGITLASIPESLGKALAQLATQGDPEIDLLRFGLRLHDAFSLDQALKIVTSSDLYPVETRVALIQALADTQTDLTAPLLRWLEKDPHPAVHRAVINALRRVDDPRIPSKLITQAASHKDPNVRALALNVLAGRPDWASILLDNVPHTLSREAVSIDHLLVIQRHNDADLIARIETLWGTLRQPEEEKKKRIAETLDTVRNDPGDPQAGQALYTQLCATCHKLFDQGAAIGPELTGYERSNLEFLVTAIIDPNLGVREEYELTTITLRPKNEGSPPTILSGFVKALTETQLTLQDLTGQSTTIATQDILTKQNSPVSIMPEGLLETLTKAQIRHLFAYLQK